MSRQSSNNNRRVRWYWLLRWKMRWIMTTKTKMVVIFNSKKFSFIDFVLTDRWRPSGKRSRSARSKSSCCRFSFSAERNANTKATEYTNFGFSFNILVLIPILGKFEPHRLSTIRIFYCFRRHNLRKLQQTTRIENHGGLAVHSSTWPGGAKGKWRVGSWLAISTHVKKYDIFSRMLLRLFSGPDNLVQHRSLCDKYSIYIYNHFYQFGKFCTDITPTNSRTKWETTSVHGPQCNFHLRNTTSVHVR